MFRTFAIADLYCEEESVRGDEWWVTPSLFVELHDAAAGIRIEGRYRTRFDLPDGRLRFQGDETSAELVVSASGPPSNPVDSWTDVSVEFFVPERASEDVPPLFIATGRRGFAGYSVYTAYHPTEDVYESLSGRTSSLEDAFLDVSPGDTQAGGLYRNVETRVASPIPTSKREGGIASGALRAVLPVEISASVQPFFSPDE
jgi:hypothetical protein